MGDKIKFLISYDHYTTYVHNYSSDWPNFKKSNYTGYINHHRSHVEALEKFTESKFNSGFLNWFTELFLKFVHLKANDPHHDSDMLVYKVTSIVSSMVSSGFALDNSFGNLESKTVDSLKDALNQFQKRSAANTSNNEKKKRKLEDINPEIFTSLTDSREFIGHLMNKLARYKNHLDIFKLHLAKESTPASLFYCNFPAPFLSDDEVFVEAYNKLIQSFQSDAMNLIMNRLSFFVNLINDKLEAIKTNLSKNYQEPSFLDSTFDDLNKSVMSGLENSFKASLDKVDRCQPRPYVAGVIFRKRKSNVKFNNSSKSSRNVSTVASSLNSSVSSLSSSNQTRPKPILRNNANYSSSSVPNSQSVLSSSESSTQCLQTPSSARNSASNQNFRFYSTSKSKFDPYASSSNA
jgi:hypothetical protein